mgnify:CR=1 FL=1
MEEQIIDIIEVTGYTEVSDTDMTFSELEIEEEDFAEIIATLEDEFDIRISKKDAADLYEGSVDEMIQYIDEKVNGWSFTWSLKILRNTKAKSLLLLKFREGLTT